MGGGRVNDLTLGMPSFGVTVVEHDTTKLTKLYSEIHGNLETSEQKIKIQNLEVSE